MKANKEFSILHFSDLHFGEDFMLKDERRPGDFENYFIRFQTKVNDIIKNEFVDLIIISGDFCSQNLFYTKGIRKKKLKRRKSFGLPEHLKRFLDIFKNENIPIVICIGNHEINRDIKKHEERTEIYRELKELIKDYMNSDFSVKFDQNFINYKVYEKETLLAFSIDTTFSLRDKKWKDPSIELSVIKEFFKELDSSGLDYSSFKKILVCHYPIKEIPNCEDIIPYLIDHNFDPILSGHFHKKYVEFIHKIGTNKLHLNLIAGSPFLNLKKRLKGQLWNPVALQFNYYVLSGRNWEQLSAYYYFYNYNKEWEKKKLIPLYKTPYGFYSWLERIKDQTKNHPSEEKIKILKEKGVRTEDEEMRYISWVFSGFIKNYSFKLEDIKLICNYFRIQVEIFFSDKQNFKIIEKVLIQAGIDKGEKFKIFLENLKQGKKIWIGTIQEFQQYLIEIFNLAEETVEKIRQESYNEMKFVEPVKFAASTTDEIIQSEEYIENDEIIKSTLELINKIFANKIKDSKLKRKFESEFGGDITDLNDTLLNFAAHSLAHSFLDYEGIFLFIWRDRLQNLIKKYVNNKLKDEIPRSSNLKNYVEMITNYTLFLAKDNIEIVYNN